MTQSSLEIHGNSGIRVDRTIDGAAQLRRELEAVIPHADLAAAVPGGKTVEFDGYGAEGLAKR